MGFLVLRSSATQGSGGGDPDPDPGEGEVIFDPGDLGNYANADEIFTVDTNDHDSGHTTLQSSVTRSGGSSKAILIEYPNDEAGTQLMFPAFTATPTLYYRWAMMLGSGWSGKLPVGLKITRSFTTNNWTAVVGESASVLGDAYVSPKLWSKYQDVESGFNPDGIAGDPDATHFWGTCQAFMNLDAGAAFADDVNFDNGEPYVQPGVWYWYEIYQTINSADGVADGSFELRVDRKTVYKNTALAYVNSASPRFVGRGLDGFQSLWFGGNYSGGDFPDRTTLSPSLDRYEDSYFVSTNARWLT